MEWSFDDWFQPLNTTTLEKSWYERNKEKVLKQRRERYLKDLEFREKARATYRERYQNDPDYRAKTLQRAKERYHIDEDYRRATNERSKKQRKKSE